MKKKLKVGIFSLEDMSIGLFRKTGLSRERKLVVDWLETVFADRLDLPVEFIDKGDLSEYLTDKDKEELEKAVRVAPFSNHKQIEAGMVSDIAYRHIDKFFEGDSLLITGYDLYAKDLNFICSQFCYFTGRGILSVFRYCLDDAIHTSLYEERVKYASLHIGNLFKAGRRHEDAY